MDLFTPILNKFLDVFKQLISNFTSISDTAATVVNDSWVIGIKDSLNDLIVGDDTSNGIIYYLSGIAFAIAMAYFLIGVIQLAMEEKLTPEFLVKHGAKLVVSIAIILWSPDILKALLEFGDAFAMMFTNITNTANSSITAIDTYGNAMVNFRDRLDAVPGLDFMWSLSTSLTWLLDIALLSILAVLVAPFVKGAMFFIQITRFIELYVRGAFLPIASALMADDGWRGAGGRYVRKLLSLCTQNAVILMIGQVIGGMMNGIITSKINEGLAGYTYGVSSDLDSIAAEGAQFVTIAWDVALFGLIIGAAGISFMFKAVSITDDLWGVH